MTKSISPSHSGEPIEEGHSINDDISNDCEHDDTTSEKPIDTTNPNSNPNPPATPKTPPKVFTFEGTTDPNTVGDNTNEKKKYQEPSAYEPQQQEQRQKYEYVTDNGEDVKKNTGFIPGTISIFKRRKATQKKETDNGQRKEKEVVVVEEEEEDEVVVEVETQKNCHEVANHNKNSRDNLNTCPLVMEFIEECETPVTKNGVAGSVTENQDELTVEGIDPVDYNSNHDTSSQQIESTCIDQEYIISPPPANKIIEIVGKEKWFKRSATKEKKKNNLCHSEYCMIIINLAVFGILGSTLRAFLVRIFGYDCEFPGMFQDYLSPFSTCVTASGETVQAGGALFLDLPGNMLGSFMLGIMTPIETYIPDLPWLKQNHRLQSNTSIHTAIRTGFCGSLTTFSSWNTQMIIMMVGKGTVRGIQIVPAFLGYFLGTILAITSFLSGRRFAKSLYTFRHPNKQEKRTKTSTPIIQDDVESNHDSIGSDAKHFTFDNKDRVSSNRCLCAIDCIVNGKYSPVIGTFILFFCFVIVDSATASIFHRILWTMCFISPLGVIIRWKLSSLNGKWFQNSENWSELPVGTLICNVVASIISAICTALLSRVGSNDNGAIVILQAIKIGFAGNLSTVSTFVKEIVHLSEKKETSTLSHMYAVGTIVICCCVSLVFYAPIRI